MQQATPGKTVERTVLLIIFAIVLFASPAIYLWARDQSPWFLPYALWFIFIGLTFWVSKRRKDV